MIAKDLSLPEVAAVVQAHLRKNGMDAVVVGGSAITMHVPEVYTSYDVDFAVITGVDRRALRRILKEIGFVEKGRMFTHSDTIYSLDFVADTPKIDQRPIHEFVEVSTPVGPVRVYRVEDAVADRLAGFLYWNDGQSLDVAIQTLAAMSASVDWAFLDNVVERFEAPDAQTRQRLEFARRAIRGVR